EDSSEEFADMRDKSDIRYLLEYNGLQGLKAPVSREKFDALQEEFKLTDRQLHRCIEIYLLSNVDKLNENDYKAYRLQVKHRLYTFNYDVIQSIDERDRKEKLHETYLNLEDEYHRILELI
ncbi:histone acetyltransferase 1, partial [Rhizopus stolonifer]